MPIRLLAIDLDGTLLTSDKKISAATAAVLQAAIEVHGLYIVLATARPPRSVMGFYRQLYLDTPTINYNGALVYEPPTGQVLLHRPLPLDISRALIAFAREAYPDVLVSAEVLDHWYTDRVDGRYLTETARTFQPDLIGPVESWLTCPITKLMLLGRQEHLARLAVQLDRQFAYQFSMLQTEEGLLQIMHPTAGKAAALRMVAGHLHVPREEVMAIGDNANDVGMLQWSAVGVAMGNACSAAKAAADFVTDGNDADGAARAIQEIILDGRAGGPGSPT